MNRPLLTKFVCNILTDSQSQQCFLYGCRGAESEAVQFKKSKIWKTNWCRAPRAKKSTPAKKEWRRGLASYDERLVHLRTTTVIWRQPFVSQSKIIFRKRTNGPRLIVPIASLQMAVISYKWVHHPSIFLVIQIGFWCRKQKQSA